ncbi:hypothetical protein [Algoriphagus boritolerans]|uniref:hypothetical protein n=1 Tax=Algoriphagus boritolerans TaxID=308111 RepID=UPI000A6786BA
MSFDLNSLLRPHITKLQPYTSARDEYSGKVGIFLDANENPFGSITEQDFNRYPDPYQSDLKKRNFQNQASTTKSDFLGKWIR